MMMFHDFELMLYEYIIYLENINYHEYLFLQRWWVMNIDDLALHELVVEHSVLQIFIRYDAFK